MITSIIKERPKQGKRTIIFVTFETQFAKSGGLGAVMSVLPSQMAQHERCIVLGPHFRNMTDLEKLKQKKQIKDYSIARSFFFQIRDIQHPVEIVEVIDNNNNYSYLIASDYFFTAPRDPYVNPRDPSKLMESYTNPNIPDKLTEDALFFCAVVPKVLEELIKLKRIPDDDFILHLQDWETACAAKAIQLNKNINAVSCILTIHNPYDRHLGNTSSNLVSDLVTYLHLTYDNVMPQIIPLVGSPISTVSQNFADELTTDPLHTEFFAKHFRNLLVGKGLVGIDNGIFGELKFPFSEEARQQVEQGNFEKMQQEKLKWRMQLGSTLTAYQKELAKQKDPNLENWGENLDLSNPEIPVFFIMGRDDPLQKGFDVAAEAVRMIPEGKARYIFTPLPGDEGLLGLEFLKKLAEERPGEVKVFPFRLDFAPYRALQKGSSFMIMGSLYEPFGAANSAYLDGTPVIARATGGLVQQIMPYPSACLSRYGKQLVTMFHSINSEPTGFLFREQSVLSQSEVLGWQKIVQCEYWQRHPKGDRILDRKGTPLFDAMVQSAAWAIQDAIDLYTLDQTEYMKMIFNGYKLLNRFNWKRTIREYRHIYDANSRVNGKNNHK